MHQLLDYNLITIYEFECYGAAQNPEHILNELLIAPLRNLQTVESAD